jgi:hypothetical protein
MKKQVLLLSALWGVLTTVLAQSCPTQIDDLEDDGFEYEATLSALSECEAGKPFSIGTNVSLGGQPYLVVSCYDNGVLAFARIQSNGGSFVRLAETSGIIITSGSISCAYNKMGQPVSLPVELVSFSGKNIEVRNPATGGTEGGNFQVLNLLGQQVLVGKTGQPINVSALPQGSYVFKMGAEQVKFVKQ